MRSLIGNVNQEAILFNDTFYNNITFGVENATMEQVIEAAKIANAHDFIMETEEGYNTNIGDRGCRLSGGQRQRISIARAILKNPAILILDEATSALDTESERLVQEALERLMRTRTTIAIAHRLSTIKNANTIKAKIVIWMAVVGVIALALLLLLINRWVFNPISRLSNIAYDLSQGDGDLTKRLPTRNRNEISKANSYINDFIQKIANMVLNAKDLSHQNIG